MRIWHLQYMPPPAPSYYKHEPLPGVRVKDGPLLEEGETIAVVPLKEHAESIEAIQSRCPHDEIITSTTGMLSECKLCGKSWDYD